MKYLLLVVLGVFTALSEEASELRGFQEGNLKFTADIYKELLKENSENFLVCPLSMDIVLGLVHAGAKGDTAKELSTSLHLPDDTKGIQYIISMLAPTLHVNGDYLLSSLNKIYVAETVHIDNEFQKISKTVFESDIENIDFSHIDESVLKINKWVEEATQHTIKDVLTKDCIDSNTLMLLINTMYFNGNWSIPFDTMSTELAPFHVNKTHEVDTEMMYTKGDFNVYVDKNLNATFLEMPYKGDDVTMTIVLPNEIDGLSNLENHLDEVLVRPSYENITITINIPKFKEETTTKFKSILETLGVKEAFTQFADFSGLIDGDKGPHIDDVIQKAFIEVTEKGTTAGAASCVAVADRMLNFDQFTADRPFLYFLRHKYSGILFIGRYTTPNSH